MIKKNIVYLLGIILILSLAGEGYGDINAALSASASSDDLTNVSSFTGKLITAGGAAILDKPSGNQVYWGSQNAIFKVIGSEEDYYKIVVPYQIAYIKKVHIQVYKIPGRDYKPSFSDISRRGSLAAGASTAANSSISGSSQTFTTGAGAIGTGQPGNAGSNSSSQSGTQTANAGAGGNTFTAPAPAVSRGNPNTTATIPTSSSTGNTTGRFSGRTNSGGNTTRGGFSSGNQANVGSGAANHNGNSSTGGTSTGTKVNSQGSTTTGGSSTSQTGSTFSGSNGSTLSKEAGTSTGTTTGNSSSGSAGGNTNYPAQSPGERKLEFEGRPYYIYVPSSYTPQKSWPLIITLHGVSNLGGDLTLKFMMHGPNVTNMGIVDAVKEKEDFIVVAPLAASPSRGWQYTSSSTSDIAYIKNLEAHLKKNFNISKVFLDGHSSGGFMTFYYGIPNSTRYAGLSTTGAYMLSYNNFSKPVPVHIGIATGDRVDGAKSTKSMLENAGFPVELVVFEGSHPSRPLSVLKQKVAWMRKIVAQ